MIDPNTAGMLTMLGVAMFIAFAEALAFYFGGEDG